MVEQFLNNMMKVGGGILGAGIFAQNFIFVVDGGERALKMDALRGLQPDVYGEGMHFRIPALHKITRFEIRSRPTLVPSSTGTKDLQTVDIALRILFRPREDKLSEIYNNTGIDYDKRILPSISNEVLKSVVAQYNAEQLISMREKVSKEIRDILGKRALEFNIILDDVSITDLQFSQDFTASIEQK